MHWYPIDNLCTFHLYTSYKFHLLIYILVDNINSRFNFDNLSSSTNMDNIYHYWHNNQIHNGHKMKNLMNTRSKQVNHILYMNLVALVMDWRRYHCNMSKNLNFENMTSIQNYIIDKYYLSWIGDNNKNYICLDFHKTNSFLLDIFSKFWWYCWI